MLNIFLNGINLLFVLLKALFFINNDKILLERGVGMEWTVEGYKASLHEQFSQYSAEIIEGFKKVKQESYSEDVSLLQVMAFIGEPTIDMQLFFMADMFDEAGTEALDFLEDALLDKWLDVYGYGEDSEAYEEFYEENELEDILIAELGQWIKACFNEANGSDIRYPIYFGVHDGPYMLDLHTNEWINPDESDEDE